MISQTSIKETEAQTLTVVSSKFRCLSSRIISYLKKSVFREMKVLIMGWKSSKKEVNSDSQPHPGGGRVPQGVCQGDNEAGTQRMKLTLSHKALCTGIMNSQGLVLIFQNPDNCSFVVHLSKVSQREEGVLMNTDEDQIHMTVPNGVSHSFQPGGKSLLYLINCLCFPLEKVMSLVASSLLL